MATTEKVRVIPKNTFDALELSILVAGGKIGSGACQRIETYDDAGNPVVIPVCLLGHINFLTGEERLTVDVPQLPETLQMFRHVGARLDHRGSEENLTEENDMIVDRRGVSGVTGREMTWPAYCKARNWVRGR